MSDEPPRHRRPQAASRDDAERFVYGVHPVMEALAAEPPLVERVLVARDHGARTGRLFREARDLGARLANAITTRQRFPEQEEALEQSFEIMRWLVSEHKDIWPYEFEYWQKHWGTS